MNPKLLMTIAAVSALTVLMACDRTDKRSANDLKTTETARFRLITLDPGHFHAALVQKSMNDLISPVAHVYSPGGFDLTEHLKRIESYNKRSENPTNWDTRVYQGGDFLEKLIREKAGNVVIIAGNNAHKTSYIRKSVAAGLNVLSDKPMCIDENGYETLKEAFKEAARQKVLLYDIMTERYEITTRLQKAIANLPAVFGDLQKGTKELPAVTKESVHHLYKMVSGKPLVRPEWYFDTRQQGEGIVDVTTHLVDLIFWECFPDAAIRTSDIEMIAARRWPTMVDREQFARVTGAADFPEFLKARLDRKGVLPLYSNGEMTFKVNDVFVKTSVVWNYEAAAGAGDTHFSVMKGTKAIATIRQGKIENYQPELFITPTQPKMKADLGKELAKSVSSLQTDFPGVGIKEFKDGWQVTIPEKYRDGHEAHFAQVAAKYLRFLSDGRLPDWEVPNMLAKYYVTTQALKLAAKQ